MRIDVGDHELAASSHLALGRRRTVILLHGLAGSRQDWNPFVDALRPECQVVTLDLVGHGESGIPPHRPLTFDRVADELVRVADHFGAARPTWIGYSFGARLLLHLALRHPDRVGALVLESAHPGIQDPAARARRARQDEDDAALLEREGLETFLDAWHRRDAFQTRRRATRAWDQEVQRKRTSNRPAHLARCLRDLGVGAQPPLLERAAEIKAPTLLLAGSLDVPYVEFARSLHESMARSTLTVVPDVGHCIHCEDPHAWTSQVRSFLDAHSAFPLPVAPEGA